MTQPSRPESTDSSAAMSGSMTPRADAFSTLRNRATQIIGSMADRCPALTLALMVALPYVTSGCQQHRAPAVRP